MRYTDTRASAAPAEAGQGATAAPSERTVIYCRLSLDAEGRGEGVEAQEEACRAFCESMGWAVDAVLVDNDISATTGKRRPAFEQLLADPPTRVVVWHTDRLVRLTKELERVIEAGFLVHPAGNGQRGGDGGIDLSTHTGQAVAKTITTWAEYEGKQKSARQKLAHGRRARKGQPFWSHRRPFGFTEKGEHHETEAVALRECFSMIRSGETFAACASWLNSQGFTTTKGRKVEVEVDGVRKVKWEPIPWRGPALSRTMRHPRNAGLIVYGNEIVGHGQWSPIVSEEEWRAILARSEALPQAKAATAGGDKIKSLLGGLAHCAECGAPVKRTVQQSIRKKGKPDEFRVMTNIYRATCPPAPRGESGHAVTISEEWLDDYVTKAVLREAVHPRRALLDGPPVESEEAQRAAAEAVRLREKLENVARREAMDEITEAQAKTMTATLRERLAEVEAKAVAYYSANPLDRAYSGAELVAAWKSEELTLHHKREAVVKYLERIEVRPRVNRNERVNESMVTIKPRRNR